MGTSYMRRNEEMPYNGYHDKLKINMLSSRVRKPQTALRNNNYFLVTHPWARQSDGSDAYTDTRA